MLEDVTLFIINLKNLRFKLKNDSEHEVIEYSFKGPKEITGADLCNDIVEIVNPESYLATINEDAELTLYYQPGTEISVATVSMEQPLIYTEKDFMDNVPSGESAKFTVYMANESEAKEAMWFNLKIDDASNPNGAKIYMDGSAIGAGRRLMVPSGEILTKTIEISKYENENLKTYELQIIASILVVISEIIALYVTSTSKTNQVSDIENPNI